MPNPVPSRRASIGKRPTSQRPRLKTFSQSILCRSIDRWRDAPSGFGGLLEHSHCSGQGGAPLDHGWTERHQSRGEGNPGRAVDPDPTATIPGELSETFAVPRGEWSVRLPIPGAGIEQGRPTGVPIARLVVDQSLSQSRRFWPVFRLDFGRCRIGQTDRADGVTPHGPEVDSIVVRNRSWTCGAAIGPKPFDLVSPLFLKHNRNVKMGSACPSRRGRSNHKHYDPSQPFIGLRRRRVRRLRCALADRQHVRNQHRRGLEASRLTGAWRNADRLGGLWIH